MPIGNEPQGEKALAPDDFWASLEQQSQATQPAPRKRVQGLEPEAFWKDVEGMYGAPGGYGGVQGGFEEAARNLVVGQAQSIAAPLAAGIGLFGGDGADFYQRVQSGARAVSPPSIDQGNLLTGGLPQAVGALPTMIAGGGAGGAIGVGLTGAAQTGPQLYYDVLEKTGDRGKAALAGLAGTGLGLSEAAGGAILGKVPILAKLLGGLEEATGGAVAKRLLAGTLGAGAQEAGQEAFQSVLQAKTYEALTGEDIDEWQQAAEGAGVGGIIGSIFQALTGIPLDRASKPQAGEQALEAPGIAQETTSPAPAPAPQVPEPGSRAFVEGIRAGGEERRAKEGRTGPAYRQRQEVIDDLVEGRNVSAGVLARFPGVIEEAKALSDETQKRTMGIGFPEKAGESFGLKLPREELDLMREEELLEPEVQGPPTEVQVGTEKAIDELESMMAEGESGAQAEVGQQAGFTSEVSQSEPTPESGVVLEPEKTTSIKNRIVERELAEMGLPPAKKGERVSDRERYGRAMERFQKDQGSGARLVDELEAAQRPPTGDEGALLALEVNRLINERDAAQEAFNAEPSETNRLRIEKATQAYARTADVVTAAGTESSASLRIRKMMIARDYSLAAMERAVQVAKGGEPLTREESTRVRELHERLAAATKAHEEYVSAAELRRAELEAENALLRLQKKAKGGERRAKRTQEIAEAKAELGKILDEIASVGREARSGLDPRLVTLTAKAAVQIIKIGGKTFAQFADTMVARFGESIRPYLRDAWDSAQKEISTEVAKPLRKRMVAGEPLEKLGSEVQKLAEHFVAEGVSSRDELVDRVHGVLKEVNPEITRREAMDAISGYGVFRPLSKDEIKKKLRDLKGQMQHVAKLEDLQREQKTQKTGFERRTPSEEEARLAKQVAGIKRALAIKPFDPEKAPKAALKAAKTRMQKEISDLEMEMDVGALAAKGKRPQRTDPELERLTKLRDEMRADYESFFEEELTQRSEAQQIKTAIKAAGRSLAEIERRIKERDLTPRMRKGPTNQALELLRAERDARAAELAWLRKVSKPKKSADEIALAAYKARLKNKEAELLQRVTYKDYTPTPKREPQTDPEAIRLKAQVASARRTFEFEKKKHELAQRTVTEKAKDYAKEIIFELPRTLFSSFDFSAVRRQGNLWTNARPWAARKHIKEMFRAWKNPQAALEAQAAIETSKHFELGKRAGLELTSTDELGTQEEVLRSKIAQRIPLVEASNRAYITYLNLQRQGAFDSLVESLPYEVKLPEAKRLADLVNITTGRASGGGRAVARALEGTKIFFAPSYVVSRFQALGRPLTMLADKDLSGRAKVQIGKTYLRFVAGQAVYYGLLAAAFEGLEEATNEEFEIESDPRSANFGKIKIGDTTLDPLGGLAQVGVFLTRITSGGYRTQRGELRDLAAAKGPYDPTRISVATRFLRSKLAPVPSRIWDALEGRTYIGKEVSPVEALTQPPLPGAITSIVKAGQSLGWTPASVLGVFTMFGDGLNTIESAKKETAK